MNNTNQCPKCKQYIFGTYCYTCEDEISNIVGDIPDFLKDIFGEFNKPSSKEK